MRFAPEKKTSMKTIGYEVNIVYKVGEKLQNVVLQYKTREEAETVAALYHLGNEEQLDEEGTVGIVHDVWVIETLVKEE